jgi:hypothetical protein
MMAQQKSLKEASINDLMLLWDTCNRLVEGYDYDDDPDGQEAEWINTDMQEVRAELARRGLDPYAG